MPAPQVKNAYTFTLTPHPTTRNSAVRRIGGKIARTGTSLLVSYTLDGELERLRVPKRRTARFADDLSRHTCFEMFIARKGGTEYREFNFSPSAEWAVYGFACYRERVAVDAVAELDPHITARRAANKLELDAVARLDRLMPPTIEAPLVLGLSAVVEDNDGRLSYWALTHPLDQPDFHHPGAFVLELDEIRH